MEIEVLYWKDINKLIQMSITDKPEYPDPENLEKEYVKLPIKFNIKDRKKSIEQEGEFGAIFSKLNSDDNPMGTPKMQQWIRSHGLTHTSMSVGDIIKSKKGIYVCENFGWTKL